MSSKNCQHCGMPGMRKHHDVEKARQGFRTCAYCNMTKSPSKDPIPGSFAYFDGKKFVTGIRKPGELLFPNGRKI